MRVGINLTVNYPDGRELHDHELAAPALTDVGSIVEEHLGTLEDKNYSSLVIVVVADPADPAKRPGRPPPRRPMKGDLR